MSEDTQAEAQGAAIASTPRATDGGQGDRQRARPRKHSFSISGHRTSISLEAEFWDALREIAAAEHRSLASLVVDIDRTRGESGLSGAIRVFVLEHYQQRARPPDAR